MDLAQIRGYGLGEKVEQLLTLLALHRLRRLLDGDLRLRTACDLEPVDRDNIIATRPSGFNLPSLADLETELPAAISDCQDLMTHTTVAFEDELKKAKDTAKTPESSSGEPPADRQGDLFAMDIAEMPDSSAGDDEDNLDEADNDQE